MITFIVSILLLVAGYVLYGKYVAGYLDVDPERKTPAYEFQDGIEKLHITFLCRKQLLFSNLVIRLDIKPLRTPRKKKERNQKN